MQALLPDDEERRIEFCAWIAEMSVNDASFLSHIIWTDKTNVSNSGMMNRRNNHYWSGENPLQVREGHDQVRFSINCWCALLDNRVLAVYFYEGTLTGERYQAILETVLLPVIEELPLNVRNQLFYQQDGAPAHNSHVARGFLDDHLFF